MAPCKYIRVPAIGYPIEVVGIRGTCSGRLEMDDIHQILGTPEIDSRNQLRLRAEDGVDSVCGTVFTKKDDNLEGSTAPLNTVVNQWLDQATKSGNNNGRFLAMKGWDNFKFQGDCIVKTRKEIVD